MSNVIRIDPGQQPPFKTTDNAFGGNGVNAMLEGDRYQELSRRQAFYTCTQHDGKHWDFDGRPVARGGQQPLMGTERSWYVPLKMRRPSVPVRLGKIIVDSFTNLLFGENRFPTIKVEGDDETQDLLQTIVRVGKLPQKMIQARAYGGATGTCGLSWCFRNGKPRFEAHDPKNLFVHSWEDRLELVPEHVSEVYLVSKVKWDGRAFNKVWYWFRRDWTPEADMIFKEVPFRPGVEPEWDIDFDSSNFHDDGVCHLEWIQNLPTDEADGMPDYDGLYDSFDSIDLLMSVISRGAILNLDPTVKLKMDRDEVDRLGIKKGSDNALVVGKDGDADYMEVGGQSIDAGLKLVDAKRRYILETAQCIVPDPNEVAAQGVSSVAIKAMFSPMLAKADIIREQYGSAVERILQKMVEVLKVKLKAEILIVDPDTKAETKGKFVLNLPPKVEMQPDFDVVDQQPTGKERAVKTPRTIGEGGEISLVWPPYFSPTPDDQSKIITSLQMATGGKAFMSKQTAAEITARAFGIDPAEEWKRVGGDDAAAKAETDAMVPDIGGGVGDEHELPPGAAPKGGPPTAVDPADGKEKTAGGHDVDAPPGSPGAPPPGHPDEAEHAAAHAAKHGAPAAGAKGALAPPPDEDDTPHDLDLTNPALDPKTGLPIDPLAHDPNAPLFHDEGAAADEDVKKAQALQQGLAKKHAPPPKKG